MELFLYIILGLIAAFLLFYVLPNLVISVAMFYILLVRTSKKKWSRSVSWDNEEQKKMFSEGEKWALGNEKFRKRITIKNKRFSLVGEYFDFGFKKAVIIVPGRMETCTYSCYFAEPYKKAGYNVLAIDNRAHGLSDGKYDTLGLKEYSDIIAWANCLHDDYGNEKIWCHGICIGSATCINAFVDTKAPDCLEGLTSDGVYLHFGDMLKRQIITRGHKPHPSLEIVLALIAMHAGKNPIKNGPIYKIDKMKKPMLFIYSKQDVLSDPENCRKLYEKCGGKKKLVWFDKGIHSHIRINDEKGYDAAITDFLKENASV